MKTSATKSLLYKLYHQIMLARWRIKGGRKLHVFGEQLNLHPSTVFPEYRGMRLPEHHVQEKIVRYCDFVQMHSLFLYLSELENRPVVIEAGAHHGAYAVTLGKLLQRKNGRLIAIEPNLQAFAILQENVRRNKLSDTVHCEHVALFDRPGVVALHDSADQSFITKSTERAGTEIDAITLKMLTDRHAISELDLLIVDVEGAELNVLRGIDWSNCKVDRIFCELHPYNWKHFGYSERDMSEFLSEHGFRCFDMYLREHRDFAADAYIGPTIFIPDHE